MHTNIDSRRRVILISTIALPSSLALGGLAGCQEGTTHDRSLSFASLAEAEEEIARLAQATTLNSAAVWTWAQTLEHCAQSIEYSMSGFPQPKSKLFQATVGAAALEVFAWRGRMTHDRAEPIPGAPPIAVKTDPAVALARLRASITRFQAWSEPLQPHFAYGVLDKKQYELAHAMHLANHLSQFGPAT